MRQFNCEMVRLARDLRGLTQENLAERCGVGQAFISRIEGGDKEPSEGTLEQIASAVDLPAMFFYSDEPYTGLGISLVYFRKRAKALQTHLRRLQAEVTLHRKMLRMLLRGINVTQTNRTFRLMDIDEHGGQAEVIAKLLRASWSVPLGPVGNLVGLIEGAGGFVFNFSFGTKDIDAISQWPDDMPPLFFINSDAPMDRIRFSLAHELGHMVMHEAASEEMECEANLFAGEFLMPESEIKSQLGNLTIERASQLKPYWRVSIASLIVRAHQLRQITKDDYRGLFKQMNYMGYRKREPFPLATEEPRAIRAVLNAYLTDNGLSVAELSRLAGVYENDFRSRFVRLGPGEVRLASVDR